MRRILRTRGAHLAGGNWRLLPARAGWEATLGLPGFHLDVGADEVLIAPWGAAAILARPISWTRKDVLLAYATSPAARGSSKWALTIERHNGERVLLWTDAASAQSAVRAMQEMGFPCGPNRTWHYDFGTIRIE